MPLAAALDLAASRLAAGMRGGNSPQRAGVTPRALESPSRAPMVSRGLSSQADLDADPTPPPADRSKAEARSPELPLTSSETKRTRVSRRELRILQREQGTEAVAENDSSLRSPAVPGTRVPRRELRILQREQGTEAVAENDSSLRAPAVPGDVPEAGATEKVFPRVMLTSPGAERRAGTAEQGSPRAMPTSPGTGRTAGVSEKGSLRALPTSPRVEPDKVAADAPLTPSRGVASIPASQPQSEQPVSAALGSLEARVASRLSRGTGSTPVSMQPVVSASPVSSGRSPARERTRGEPPAALLQALMRAAARVQGVPTA